MASINEWTLTADIAKWAEQILRDRPDLPFSRVAVEERGRGSQKRRDLTLYAKSGKPAITGELKMPDSPDGRSPFQDSLVLDAHEKADRIGVEYFFTWNVNRCVLWKTFEQGKSITERYVAHFPVFPTPIRSSEQLAHPLVEQRIREFLAQLLERCAVIMVGEEPAPSVPMDEKFLLVWEAALEQPVAQTLQALSLRYLRDREFTATLDKWMREGQEWIISHREDYVRDNLERAAKLSCYVLANRIIFYKALRRRFRRMRELRIPTTVANGADFQALVADHFDHAIQVTKDYETVFRGDYGDSLPFLSDDAVDSWRDLIDQTDHFDFTQIGYEIIGQIFERTLSTEERHKFGQHYTRSEVVDLINAFCIRQPGATVLDPACGGGTFLVRAYALKRDLAGGELSHQKLLQQLHGLDIAAYPAHLSTMNLATRDLIDQANYPLVTRADFFKTDPGDPIFRVPLGSAGGQMTAIQLEKVDAVVGNPPYVRQEKIGEYYGKHYKALLREQAGRDAPGSQLSGRSDIHCYFFTHGLAFLKDGGYLGLLTSSTWLDTTYGFRLQQFLLENFEIVAVIESNCEPWFSGARVTTAITILRRQPDPEVRAANNVKFVWLTRPLSDLLTYVRSEDDRRLTFEELRERIEAATGTDEFLVSLTGNQPISVRQEAMTGLRIRIVNQGGLGHLGCLPFTLTHDDEEAESEADNNTDEQAEVAVAATETEDPPTISAALAGYVGYKWGIFLRAPDVFFKLLRRGGGAFVPLGKAEIASVKRGVTSGCDTFFFPRDITREALEKTSDPVRFKMEYGISPNQTDRLSIVKAGDGSVHVIEREYLQPVVFNLMEIDTAEVRESDLTRRVVLVSKPKNQLRGTHVLKYIRWGEREGFDERPTCASRQPWYYLAVQPRGEVLWTMAQRYRHIVPLNPGLFPCNHNLFAIWPTAGCSAGTLCAVLNSTVAALFKHFFGRTMGGDPVLKTEVVDVKMMLVPDPRRATGALRAKLERALDSLRNRHIGHLVAVDAEGEAPGGELEMADRQDLDDAVLEMLGVPDPAERTALRAELYTEITAMYRSIRAAEKRMQKFRSETTRRGRPTPHSIANEIWETLEEKPTAKTPLDFVTPGEGEIVNLPEGQAQIANDLFQRNSIYIQGRYIELGDTRRAEFAKALADCGISGAVAIPTSPELCDDALRRYEEHNNQTDERLAEMASQYTSDETIQARVVRELRRKVKQSGS